MGSLSTMERLKLVYLLHTPSVTEEIVDKFKDTQPNLMSVFNPTIILNAKDSRKDYANLENQAVEISQEILSIGILVLGNL